MYGKYEGKRRSFSLQLPSFKSCHLMIPACSMAASTVLFTGQTRTVTANPQICSLWKVCLYFGRSPNTRAENDCFTRLDSHLKNCH